MQCNFRWESNLLKKKKKKHMLDQTNSLEQVAHIHGYWDQA